MHIKMEVYLAELKKERPIQENMICKTQIVL